MEKRKQRKEKEFEGHNRRHHRADTFSILHDLDSRQLFHLVKSWTRLGLSVTLRRQERKGMPVSESRSSSSMNLNSLLMAGETQGIFWVWEWWTHELFWWLIIMCCGSSTPPVAPEVAAAAVALLSSFLNRIPQALHSDCNSPRQCWLLLNFQIKV